MKSFTGPAVSPDPTGASPDSAKAVRAGPISAIYEDGGLRYLRVGDREILRRIYLAVRDRNWGTLPVEVKVTTELVRPDHFQICYKATTRHREIDFQWESTITGTAEGRLVFTFDGLARSDFLRNRIGFCVLHPPECAGQRCRSRDAQGQWREGFFPTQIAAVNPFSDLTGFSHQTGAGDWVTLEYHGDLFEMEDQRNWADASFKTFCTPLRLPFPVEVRRGHRFQQRIEIHYSGQREPGHRATPSAPIRLEKTGAPAQSLPRIGLALAASSTSLNEKELARLRNLQLSHLRVELKPDEPNAAAILLSATATARQLNCGLEIALFLREPVDMQLANVSAAITAARPVVHRWLIFHEAEKAATDARWIRRVKESIGPLTPGAAFGSGTDHFFMELNRAQPATNGWEFVCFSSNPQVHASDRASLVETLAIHGTLVEDARRIGGGLPVVVSPVTLRMRANPAATGPETAESLDALPASVDPRQPSLFGAGWTLGCIKYLAEAGASSVTLYETIGWKGVMESDGELRWRDQFPSIPGAVFPLYHVLADVNEFQGGDVVAHASTAPLEVIALGLRQGRRRTLLVANLTSEEKSIELPPSNVGPRSIRRLKAESCRKAMTAPETFRNSTESVSANAQPRRLDPFEFIRIDWMTA